MARVSVVLPTYNERENIRVLVPKIVDVLKEAGYTYEIIVVDDNSPDGTKEEVEELKKAFKGVRLIVREKKEGVGSALREGYNSARYDFIVSLDSDLSCDPKVITDFLRELEGSYDLVVGCRHSTGGGYEIRYPKTLIKNLVSRIGNEFTRLLVGVEIHDFSLNFRGIKREVWEKIETEDKSNSMLLEMIVKTKYDGFRVGEIPVVFGDRIYGVSKINVLRESIRFLLKVINLTLEFRVFRDSR